MVQRVVFYWQHDIDLVALAAHPDFPIALWMKRAVTAYARGEKLLIPLPKPVPCGELLDTCSISFRLNPEKDADVIRVLLSIRTGYRNAAIKVIFRGYLDGVYLDPYDEAVRYITRSRVPENRRKTEPSGIPMEVLKAATAGEQGSTGVSESPEGPGEAPVKAPARESIEAPAGKHGPARENPEPEEHVEETPTEWHGAEEAPGAKPAEVQRKGPAGDAQWPAPDPDGGPEEFDLFGAVDNLR